MKRHFQILLSGALALAALQSAQAVVTLTPNTGTWTRLKWSESEMDASNRVLAWPQGDVLRVDGDNDLFEFAVPVGSRGYVDVTDIAANDDGYSVLDFSSSLASIGSTSVGTGFLPFSIEADPDVTFASSEWGSGSIEILGSGVGGTASFKIERTAGNFVSNGGVFVRARTEVIPEPSSSVLMLLGVVGLVARRRRA